MLILFKKKWDIKLLKIKKKFDKFKINIENYFLKNLN